MIFSTSSTKSFIFPTFSRFPTFSSSSKFSGWITSWWTIISETPISFNISPSFTSSSSLKPGIYTDLTIVWKYFEESFIFSKTFSKVSSFTSFSCVFLFEALKLIITKSKPRSLNSFKRSSFKSTPLVCKSHRNPLDFTYLIAFFTFFGYISGSPYWLTVTALNLLKSPYSPGFTLVKLE